jgi:2'-5' RNA ligase
MSEVTRRFVNHWTHGDHASYNPSESRLHWYVLPSAEAVSVAGQVQLLVEDSCLKPIPGPWLHCTLVQLLAARQVSRNQREALLDTARKAVGGLSPFEVDGYAVAGGQGATWMLEPYDKIAELQRRIIGASHSYLSAEPLLYTPHITMAYSHAEGDSSPVVERLRSAPRLPLFTVDRVWLLDVTREPGPEKGWYSWTVVGDVVLGG